MPTPSPLLSADVLEVPLSAEPATPAVPTPAQPPIPWSPRTSAPEDPEEPATPIVPEEPTLPSQEPNPNPKEGESPPQRDVLERVEHACRTALPGLRARYV